MPAGRPLVLVLHGCRQDAESYDRAAGWASLAEERGFAVVYAQQRETNNPRLCFTWFRPSEVTRDRGELMSIRQMVAYTAERAGSDPQRIFVTGLSAGGVEGGGFWEGKTRTALQSLLHAAALDGRAPAELFRWTLDPSAASEAVAILNSHPNAAMGWDDSLVALGELSAAVQARRSR